MKKKLTITLLILLSLSLFACQVSMPATPAASAPAPAASPLETQPTATDSGKANISIVDSRNQTIELKKAPERIVSLSPSLTEMIYALGAGSKLVGRTDYCDYPAEAKMIGSVGSITQPDLEKILALKPDLIVVSMVTPETLKKLDELKLPVAVLKDVKKLDDMGAQIEKIGRLLGRSDEAAALSDRWTKELRAIGDKLKATKPVKVYYAVSFGKDGDYAATGDTFIGDMLRLAGGENIAEAGQNWSFNQEGIVKGDPAVVILPAGRQLKDQFVKAEGYNQVKAVADGKVFEIEPAVVERQTPRLIEGLTQLARFLHPELFQ